MTAELYELEIDKWGGFELGLTYGSDSTGRLLVALVETLAVEPEDVRLAYFDFGKHEWVPVEVGVAEVGRLATTIGADGFFLQAYANLCEGEILAAPQGVYMKAGDFTGVQPGQFFVPTIIDTQTAEFGVHICNTRQEAVGWLSELMLFLGRGAEVTVLRTGKVTEQKVQGWKLFYYEQACQYHVQARRIEIELTQ